MSETSESESPKTRGGLRPRITLWSSLAIVFIIAIMAIFLVTNPVDQSDEPPAAQETTAPVDDESGDCDVPAGDTSATPDMPDDLRWEAENGWTWPVSDTYGPTQDENGYGVCFARSPLGAALMGVSLVAEGNTGNQPEAIELYVAESAGKEVYRKTLAGEAPATTPESFAGFVVDSFTQEEARITLVVANAGSPTGYVGVPETFRWIDGDWKLQVLDDGRIFQGQPTTPASGDFIAWGEVRG
ncbi:hypothetical protein GM708_13195 [Vibrio cholerae]|nr:hypothetical protein [Vibrio cholerae]